MDVLKLSLVFGALMLQHKVICAQMCSAIANFNNIDLDKAITGSTFLTLKNLGLVSCSKRCLLRSACQSFNYEPSTQKCQLNKNSTSSTDDGHIVRSVGTLSSDRTSWPSVIAGACSSTSCPANSVCVEKNGNCEIECHDPELHNGTFTEPITHKVGSTLPFNCDAGLTTTRQAQCQTDGTWTSFSCDLLCIDPPNFTRATLVSPGSQWAPGSVLEYTCSDGYLPLGKVMCRPDGTWTEMTCVKIVRNCSDLLKCNPNSTDGDYWLSPVIYQNQLVKIYCHNMTSNAPQEFLTLPEENYVESTDSTRSCMPDHSCESVRFNKVRISDVTKMVINLTGLKNYQFTNTSCSSLVFGAVMDCNAHKNCKQTETRDSVINTKGTGLKISPQQEWWVQLESTTLMDPITVVKEDDGRKITVKCHQPCYWCYPRINEYSFVVDDDFTPEIAQAIIPSCTSL